MTALLLKLVSGIGLFLLGMVLLTDGLTVYAGDALRHGLVYAVVPGGASAACRTMVPPWSGACCAVA